MWSPAVSRCLPPLPAAHTACSCLGAAPHVRPVPAKASSAGGDVQRAAATQRGAAADLRASLALFLELYAAHPTEGYYSQQAARVQQELG